MRVAALYDIHGNLPALEAVLEEMFQIGVDQIVVGGDVVPGPMPCETIDRLHKLDLPVAYLQGNGEVAVLATMSGAPTRTLPREAQIAIAWTGRQLRPSDRVLFGGWPKTIRLAIAGIGDVLFCHATPRNEDECFTKLTPEATLAPIFDDLDVALVVCGHTHMQFDRAIAGVRVVNAGSVGMPFGEAGAYWLLLGPDVQFRHTRYDLGKAVDRIRGTAYPQAESFATRSILKPPTEAEMLEVFGKAGLQ